MVSPQIYHSIPWRNESIPIDSSNCNNLPYNGSLLVPVFALSSTFRHYCQNLILATLGFDLYDPDFVAQALYLLEMSSESPLQVDP